MTLFRPHFKMMLFKVITITLITICAADNQNSQSQPESELGLAKRRLNKQFFSPFNYFNAKFDRESAPSLLLRPFRAATATPNIFRRLQYAPLNINGAPLYKIAAQEYTTVPTTTENVPVPMKPTELHLDKKSRISFGKSHLEPRGMVPDTKCYAPEFTSVSRSPGLNAVYRKNSIPQNIKKEKPSGRKKVYEYVRPSGINLNLEALTTTFTPLIDLKADNIKADDVPITLAKPNRLFVINPIKTVIPVKQGKAKRQYSPLTKYHRLHLNIARVYSPAQSNPGSHSGNFARISLHAYPDLSQENIDYQKTYPHLGYNLRFK